MRDKQPAEKLVLDTTERPTGRTYNGKLTYMKAVPIASIPAGTSLFAHGITGLEDIVLVGGSVRNGTGDKVPF